MNISYDLYKVFYYTAKELSFSSAAHKLYISQSAVSQSIRLLEEKLGCRLFIRSTKQVRLSQEGELLYQHVEKAFNYLDSGVRSVQEIQGLKQGEIRLGSSDTICQHYLLPYLQKFKKEYPQIKIKITNRTSPICEDLLRKGLVDLIIINLKDEYEDLEVKKLKTIHDVFIAGPSFSHLQNQRLGFEDLLHYPLLLLEKNTTTRNYLDALLLSRGIKVQPEIETGSVDLQIMLAKIGLGLAFVSQEYIQEPLEKKEIFIVPLKEEIPARSLGLAVNNKLPLPLAVGKFIELLEE